MAIMMWLWSWQFCLTMVLSTGPPTNTILVTMVICWRGTDSNRQVLQLTDQNINWVSVAVAT